MKNKAFYYAASTTAILLWSASFIATKFAYTTFSPLMVGFLRFLLATVLLGIVKLLSKNKDRPDKKDRKRIALSGLFGITLYFAAENIGVGLTTASNASLIVASFPAITTLFEFFIYQTKPTFPKLLGITLAFGGVAVLAAKSGFGGIEALWGNLFLIIAGIVWTFYNFLTRSVAEKYSPTTLSFYQFLFGTIFFIPLVLIERKPIGAITAESVAAMIYLALGCSVVAFLLYNWGLRRLSAATSVSLMNLVPVFGLIFSALLLKETITLTQILGGSIVIVGVILSSITISNKKKG